MLKKKELMHFIIKCKLTELVSWHACIKESIWALAPRCPQQALKGEQPVLQQNPALLLWHSSSCKGAGSGQDVPRALPAPTQSPGSSLCRRHGLRHTGTSHCCPQPWLSSRGAATSAQQLLPQPCDSHPSPGKLTAPSASRVFKESTSLHWVRDRGPEQGTAWLTADFIRLQLDP